MGKRGPPPKPTALKMAQGNPGKRALNREEPAPRLLGAHELQPSEALEEPLARKAWEQLAPELQRLGLLTVIDRHALAEYCLAYAERMAAQRDIDELGRILVHEKEDGTSYHYPNPAVKQRDNAIRRMKDWGARFGLSPADRARIHVTPPEDDEVARQQAFFGTG